MIKGTNADCKVLGIDVSGNEATVRLLVFATSSTYPSKPVMLAIQDKGSSERETADGNVYWIDRATNYDMDARNVDTNKYKEILLSIDISKGYEGEIDDWKWVRRCSVLMLDQTSSTNETVWSSGSLTLISEPFDMPDVVNVGFRDHEPILFENENAQKTRIRVSFDLKYASKKDVSYYSSNAKAYVRMKHISTGKTLEEKEATIPSDLKCSVLTDGYYDYGEPVMVEIIICDRIGDVHSTVRKIARIGKKRSGTYVKTMNGVREAIAYFVKEDPREDHEGDWL